jgi:hypothetical protein
MTQSAVTSVIRYLLEIVIGMAVKNCLRIKYIYDWGFCRLPMTLLKFLSVFLNKPIGLLKLNVLRSGGL